MDTDIAQVKSSNASTPLKNYYAIGDCCSTPGWKTTAGAVSDADACAIK
jgi:thioredoxin reductase